LGRSPIAGSGQGCHKRE